MLTAKQKAFVEEIMANGYNQTKAYMTVFQCDNQRANREYRKLTKKPEIQEYLKQLQEEAVRAAGINAAKVLKELDAIAFDPESSKSDKLKALDLLSKNLGIQTQNIKADVNANVINLTIGEEEDGN